MISVLMPSRERPEMAKKSIASLGYGDYEVIMYLDKDDPTLEEYLTIPAYHVVSDRVGYKNFHKMINHLAKKSNGEWLMLWNDDAIMDCEDWSSKVHQQDHSVPVVLNITNPGVDTNNLFPVISRTLYKIMGHYSKSTHCDSWVQDLANELDIHLSINGTHIEHIRDRLNDKTKQETQAVYRESSPEYSSDYTQNQWRLDVAKVRRALDV